VNAGAPTPRRSVVTVIVVLVAVTVGPLNSTMIVIGLPAITAEFGLPASSGAWLVTAYLIASAGVMPVAGTLGDRYGRRPVLIGGLALFLLASVGALVAPQLAVLAACRIGQAIGGGVIMPNAIAILRSAVDARRLGRVLGLVGMAAPLGAAAGPPVGGLLLAAAGWRATFAVNIPLVALPLIAAVLVLPRGERKPGGGRFDVLGAVLACVMFVAFARALDPGDGAGPVLWPVALVVSSGAFLWRELRHPHPAVQPRLLANPGFAAAAAGVLLNNFAMYGTLLTLPLLLELRASWPATATGVALAAMMIASAVVAPFGGWFADRGGRPVAAVTGFVVTAGGLAMLAWFGPALPFGGLCLCLALTGIGMGLSNPLLQTLSVLSVEPSETGMASGVFSTSRYLGSITCSALLAGPLAATVARPDGFTTPFAVYAMAALVAALLFASLSRVHSRRTEPGGVPLASAHP